MAMLYDTEEEWPHLQACIDIEQITGSLNYSNHVHQVLLSAIAHS